MNLRATIAVLGLAVLAAGCSTPTDGTANPPATVPSSQTLPYGGAPKVENPLPDNVFSGTPCEALTAEQIKAQLGSEIPGKPGNDPVPTCTWTNSNSGGFIGVSFYGKGNDGLSNVYTNVRPQMKRFDALPPIQGFPAVAYSFNPGPFSSSCNVNVGVTDQLSFLVDVAPRNSKVGNTDPCPLAADVANDVITTLKQKSGR